MSFDPAIFQAAGIMHNLILRNVTHVKLFFSYLIFHLKNL